MFLITRIKLMPIQSRRYTFLCHHHHLALNSRLYFKIYGQTSRDMRRLGDLTLFWSYFRVLLKYRSWIQILSRGPHFIPCTAKRSRESQYFELSEHLPSSCEICFAVLTPWVDIYALRTQFSILFDRTQILTIGCGEVKWANFIDVSDVDNAPVNRWLSVRFNLLSSAVVGVTALVSILTPRIDAALAGFALAFASTITNDVRVLTFGFTYCLTSWISFSSCSWYVKHDITPAVIWCLARCDGLSVWSNRW